MALQPILGPGDAAPDFVLPTSDGRPRARADLMGPRGLVLMFLRGTW